ncbi:uncharacterized protein LOC141856277 [Brevipalpus obovatus]|uniref:uncharacterized protein LOC141856277 n=1 Tax=Brevipalpus obovatus TaxID=246614 RepID=UPI003D9E1697
MIAIVALATLFAVANAGFLHAPAYGGAYAAPYAHGGLYGGYGGLYGGYRAPYYGGYSGLAGPVVSKTIAAPAYAGIAAPAYGGYGHHAPLGASYTSVVQHAAPVVHKTVHAGLAAPITTGYAGYGHGYGLAAPAFGAVKSFGVAAPAYGYGHGYGLAAPAFGGLAHSKVIY